jgi:hypothetical protein
MIRETAALRKTEKYEYYSSPVIPLQKNKTTSRALLYNVA